jgi:hypothetical protein
MQRTALEAVEDEPHAIAWTLRPPSSSCRVSAWRATLTHPMLHRGYGIGMAAIPG